MQMCPPIAMIKNVTGAIATYDNKPVENVQVKIIGTTEKTTTSDVNGQFVFNNLNSGSYDLIPEKNELPLNGVSTFDLIIMSKHILGVQPFTASNQFIAADINANGVVSTADVVELRKMILGLQSDFSKNKSWRFVEKGVTYSTSNVLSWLANLPTKKQFFNLDNPKADFTAIKVGDLNMSAKANSAPAGNGRNAQTTDIIVSQDRADAGEVVTLTFKTEDLRLLEGYQLALNYDKNALELVDIQGERESFAVLEDGLITHSQVGKTSDNENMFGLTFRAKEQVEFQQVIHINEKQMAAEAYLSSGESRNIALKFRSGRASKSLELFQNQPNPFSGASVIGFSLPEPQHIKLSISDISGRVIKTIEGDYQPGYQQIVIEANELSGRGLYAYRLDAGKSSVTKKMVIIE